MKKLSLILPVLLLLAGAAFAQPPAHMTPADAISGAAKKPDEGIRGDFEFVVASVGGADSKEGHIGYINSDVDYRDPANLSITVKPLTLKDLAKTWGADLNTLVGKHIIVEGTAKQIRINEYGDDHKRTGRYYFQTRIEVKGADQIKVVP